MEKIQQQKEPQTQKNNDDHNNPNKPLIWDCGSSLYDSFELKSLTRQLDSAIASRTLSMPHLPDRRAHDHAAQPNKPKPISKISRPFHKLLKSVFGPKQKNTSSVFDLEGSEEESGFYVVCDKSSGSLSKIPEVAGGVLPGLDETLVKRSVSERSTATSVGISCAIFIR